MSFTALRHYLKKNRKCTSQSISTKMVILKNVGNNEKMLKRFSLPTYSVDAIQPAPALSTKHCRSRTSQLSHFSLHQCSQQKISLSSFSVDALQPALVLLKEKCLLPSFLVDALQPKKKDEARYAKTHTALACVSVSRKVIGPSNEN